MDILYRVLMGHGDHGLDDFFASFGIFFLWASVSTMIVGFFLVWRLSTIKDEWEREFRHWYPAEYWKYKESPYECRMSIFCLNVEPRLWIDKAAMSGLRRCDCVPPHEPLPEPPNYEPLE